MTKILAIATAASLSLAGSAYASTFQGKFYDTGGLQGGGSPLTSTMTQTETFLAANPAATATFDSTGIDYGDSANGYLISDLDTFLGADSASLSGSGGVSMLGSVISISGTISLDAGVNAFNVFSDDGFSLRINGSEIGRRELLTAPNNFGFNFDAGAGGNADFEIVWFEGSLNHAALAVQLNGETISAVPLPAAGFLLFGALGGLAVVRRRKKAA